MPVSFIGEREKRGYPAAEEVRPERSIVGSGKEALKREYYLYKAQVAPYDSYDDRMSEKILGNRVEQIIGQEVARWAARPDGKDENSGNIQSHHND